MLVDAQSGVPVDPVLVDRETGRPITEADHRYVAGAAAGARVRQRYGPIPPEPKLTEPKARRRDGPGTEHAMSVAALDEKVTRDHNEPVVSELGKPAFNPRTNRLLNAPILSTLLLLAWPNVLVMVAQASTA